MSVMGLYQQDMIFHGELSPPLIIPKFVIFVFYYEVVGSIQADITFKVSVGDESNLLAEMPILRKDLPPSQEVESAAKNTEDSERIFHIRIPIVLSPFVVEKLGRLRVRAHYSDGNVLKLGSLAVKVMPTKEYQELLAKPSAPAPNID